MRTITKEIYKFEELSDEAKEKAREWYREGSNHYDWWEFILEDVATIADLFGLDLKTRLVKLMGGGTRHEPCIYFRGFSSQGDGACFEGTYRYKKGALKAVMEYAPQDKTLHEIVRTLQELQKQNFYQAWCRTEQVGRYFSMSVEVGRYDDKAVVGQDDFYQCMRDFADWIYRRLESEYEFLNSDEVVDEGLIENGYEFDEYGEVV